MSIDNLVYSNSPKAAYLMWLFHMSLVDFFCRVDVKEQTFALLVSRDV